jgi:hypothetical protein
MIAGTPGWGTDPQSGHGSWCDQLVSHATRCGANRSATFLNATVYTSYATSRGMTQLLVASQSLARPKGLVLANLV